jgi:hypothetical protein
MATDPHILLLGFAAWTDASRGLSVAENPAALAVHRAARRLSRRGFQAQALSVEVSDDGVLDAAGEAERLGAEVVIAIGQTPTGPRVERFGRIPSRLRPPSADEPSPWLLAPDADALVMLLSSHIDDMARLEPWRTSDDAGAYHCDHLCVELARLSQRTGATTRFLHVTAIDGCPADVREARVEAYARQTALLAEHLAGRVRRVA